MLIICAVILMFLALICYSVGVWAERLSCRLKPWHLAFFWSGKYRGQVSTFDINCLVISFKINLCQMLRPDPSGI